jgi:mono/diheme cytochrome c family protein
MSTSALHRRSVLPLLLIVGMLGILGAAAADETGGTAQNGATNPFAGNADAAKSGRQIFLQTGCYNCHGLDAKGGGIAPDLSASKLDPQQMFRTIHDGRPGTLMPSWGKELSSGDIWKVITYLQSLRQGG